MENQPIQEIAPIAARFLMPSDYLKRIKDQCKARIGRDYSISTISYVVLNGRSRHKIWPLIVELALEEQKRIKREQEMNAQFLKGLEA